MRDKKRKRGVPPAKIFYVNVNKKYNSKLGTSPKTAFNNLESAFDAIQCLDQRRRYAIYLICDEVQAANTYNEAFKGKKKLGNILPRPLKGLHYISYL